MGETIMSQSAYNFGLRTYTPLVYSKLLQHSECTIEVQGSYQNNDLDSTIQSSAIEIANYGDGENLAIECMKCGEIILDVDRPIHGGE